MPAKPVHLTLLPVCLAVLASLAQPAAATDERLDSLKNLSLEQLADLQISIASNRSERLEDAAAAVFVLTSEDIRRAGATTLPELLRTIPGFNVARISASEWAVSARGFNGQFANKLLVMIDGRSIYTPLFSGVLWDEHNILLQDIDRIEVVRGPGAATWGANAVNGVINIITRSARDTQGGLLSLSAGNMQREIAVRQGFALSADGAMRLFAKQHHQAAFDSPPGLIDADTAWNDGRVGFRADWSKGDGERMLQGEAYQSRVGPWHDYRGVYLLTQGKELDATGGEDHWQAYLQRFDMDWNIISNGAIATLDTLDLSWRHLYPVQGAHQLTLGSGYRGVRTDAAARALTTIGDTRRTDHVFSAFVQDDIQLADDLGLTLGMKVEHNGFTGMEWQPSLRLRWRPSTGGTVWAAVSRAVKTPTLVEDDVALASPIPDARALNPLLPALPLTITSRGNHELKSESVIAYELGYRLPVTPRWNLDVSAFLNDYDNLISVDMQTPVPVGLPFGPLTWDAIVHNNTQARTHGLEIASDFRASDTWRLQAAYSYIKLNVSAKPGNTALNTEFPEGESPQHQFSIVSHHDLAHRVELDVQLRHVAALHAYAIDAYTTADARLAWRPRKDLEVALTGRNLLRPHQIEFGQAATLSSPSYLAPREFYASATWRF